jgi:hypothetical protein
MGPPPESCKLFLSSRPIGDCLMLLRIKDLGVLILILTGAWAKVMPPDLEKVNPLPSEILNQERSCEVN